MKPTQEEERNLWLAYHQASTPSQRNRAETQVLARFSYLIDQMASRYARTSWISRDELKQEARIAIVQDLPLFDPTRGQLTPFIRVHVRHALTRLVQGRAITMRANEDSDYENISHADGTDNDLMDSHRLTEVQELREAMERLLSEEDRNLVLRDMAGHRMADIASDSGLSRGTIKKRVAQAMALLRWEMTDE